MGCWPKPAWRAPASTSAASTTCGATLTLATSWPAATIDPSRAVKTSRGSMRLSNSSSRGRTWTTPAAAASRSTRLSFGPRVDQPRPGDRGRQPKRGRVLVQVVGSGDDDRQRPDARRDGPGRASAARSTSVSCRPLDQRDAVDDQVANDDRPDHLVSARWPGRSVAVRTERSGGAGERGLDRAAGEDLGHGRPVLAVGVDVAVDRAVDGRLGGRRRDRRPASRPCR